MADGQLQQNLPGGGRIVRLLLKNPVFANILMLVLLGGGVFGVASMVRESFPDFDLDMLYVSVPYPGADPEEVAEGICRPLEEALEGTADVKSIFTVAQENAGLAVIEIQDGGDAEEVKADIKASVDAISTFPADAERPIINDLKFRREVINMVVWGDLQERQLKELAREIKEELSAIEGISRVSLFGVREYQVSIEVSEAKLRQYNLQFSQVTAAIRQSTLNLPGGSVRSMSEDLKIRVMGRKYYAREFQDLPIISLPNGAVRRLTDVAEVIDTFDPETESYALFNGKPAARLVVSKTDAEDSIKIAEIVRTYADMKRKKLPPSVNISVSFDISRLIQDRIDLLTRNGLIGLALVFLCLWLFLDLRMSFWVTAGIPISFAGALLIMHFAGQSLNMISLFGLIMVLGIIVDDAIVVGEAIYAHREQGEGAFQAAVSGVREVFWSVVAAVITTIVAFLPLFFIAGGMGKFIFVLPIPVVAALFVSLFEALLILPVHLRHLPDPNKRKRPVMWLLAAPLKVRRFCSKLLTRIATKFYRPMMDHILRWRYVAIAVAICLLLLTAGMVAGNVLKYRFFPAADGDYLQVVIEMPNGTPIHKTEAAARQAIAAWEKTEKHFEGRTTTTRARPLRRLLNLFSGSNGKDRTEGQKLSVGTFSLVGGRVSEDVGGTSFGNNVAHIFLELQPAEERNLHFKEIEAVWREKIGIIPGAESVSVKDAFGGPGGADIELDLLGRDHDQLVAALAVVTDSLKEYKGVVEVDSSHKPGKQELRIRLKDEARTLDLTLQDVAAQLRQGFYGDEVSRVQRGADEVKIMVRYPEAERRSLAQLEGLRIRTRDGREVPFELVAHVEMRTSPASIQRESGQQLIRVTAKVDKTVDSGEIVAAAIEKLKVPLADKYGVILRPGPRARDQQESVLSIQIGFIFALAMIFLIMATIFRSYLQPAVIMLTIPFGLLGAVFGHVIYDLTMGEMPLSIMTFFGMVALTGVVVNDSIVLIVAVNDRIRDGMPVMEALAEGGKRRFRAIILTSLTTFAGLFPMILEKSFQAQILIPMALSIAFGVAFASTATLILIPCLLGALNDIRRLVHYLWHGRMPTREEVELPEVEQ